jgi:hypothetical protein
MQKSQTVSVQMSNAKLGLDLLPTKLSIRKKDFRE